jgi:hypothetical protein
MASVESTLTFEDTNGAGSTSTSPVQNQVDIVTQSSPTAALW